MWKNQSVHPQKRKKKQSIVTKAKDSRTVTKVHNTSSTMEKSSHLKLCKLQPLVKHDKLKSGQRKTDVGRENSKTGHRKNERDHMGHICLCFPAGWEDLFLYRGLGSKPPRESSRL
ncbi:hypothetical protein CRYUN_Cryun10bG0005500 [Craigia yunnanensis]